MRVLIGGITVLLVLQACFSYAKVIKKVKHVGHHHKGKRSLEAFGLTRKDDCVDHTYCIKYSALDCASFFVKNNCKALCGLCGQHKKIKLPMVLYYNKHKAAAKKHVVRRAADNPYNRPTVSYPVFDYKGGYNHWNFLFPRKHPIWVDWNKPPKPLSIPADQSSNQTNNQQNQQADQAAPAADQPSYQSAPAQNNYTAPSEYAQAPAPTSAPAPAPAAYPAAQNEFQPQTATPEQNYYQNQQPAAAAPADAQTNNETTTIKLPNSALQQANQGKDVYVALVDEDKSNNLNKPSYTLSAVQNDEPQKQKDDSPSLNFNFKPVKVKCPPGQECYKGPNAPQVNHTFMVYCDDRFPSCGALHSSCNDSWLQLYCPKRCNLCRPEGQQQTKPMPLDTTQNTYANSDQQQQQQPQTQFGNKVYPTKITELKDESPKMESELVAPEPGQKAERARYTLHVAPKLKDGLPQTQEILIMPPSAVPGSDVKPLVILKQKVTKPMVENIEIDVPPKGTAYSDEPKVEVIEGNKHETLNVVGGQADLSQAEADLQASNAQQAQDAVPTQTTPSQTTEANNTTPGNYGNWTTTTTSTPAPATQAAQDTQAQYSQSETQTQTQTQAQTQTPTYQDTQSQTTQTQAAQPTQSYQDTQAQASQTQAAQPEATQTQATQDQTQQQSAQYYAQSTAAPAPTEAPAAYPAQQDSQQTYTAAQACSDEALCATYTDNMCNQSWLQTHCKSKCKLCS